VPRPVRTLTLEEARRIAVRAQLLDADRPSDLLTVIDRLAFLQLDPTAAIAPSADLITWSRIGNSYLPAHLVQALERDRTVFEQRSQDVSIEPPLAMLRPMADLALHLADMASWSDRWPRAARWVDANDAFRRRVLHQLADVGPLQSRDIPDTSAVPWESSGWTHDRNVTQLLEFLLARGEVAVAGRRGRQRLWDVAERVYPPGVVAVPSDEALARRDERRLRALGVARPPRVGAAGEPAVIEGTVGEWRVDPTATAAGFEGRTALLSPFDRLIHDRERTIALFGFEYVLEMYKPATHRRWGYFALPVLHHDRLIGKVDAAVDRKAHVLQVHAIHPDARITKPRARALDAELKALATWLGVDLAHPA
jgi:uncharacterized protein